MSHGRPLWGSSMSKRFFDHHARRPAWTGRYVVGAAICAGLLCCSPAEAQLRASVGCPGLKLDQMPNLSTKELQCQCFGKCGEVTAAPPPPSPPSNASAVSFDMCSNCWVKGDGYAKFRSPSADSCRQTCRGDSKCLTFEFYAPGGLCNLYASRRAIEMTRGQAIVGVRN